MVSAAAPRRITGLSEIATPFRAVLCDVWGVVHNGVEPYPEAVDALIRYRQTGGIVMLISNAPRPRPALEEQLRQFGVDKECWDGLITSGDVAKAVLSEHVGARVYHLGPDWDHYIYEDLDVELCDLDSADIVSCVGFVDDRTETVDDYEDLLREMEERGLPMLCANPDLVVERGDQLVPCAGAIAARYLEIGGEAMIVGKPHPPIYERALADIGALAGAPIAPEEILAIGDGAGTDIFGANQAGLPALFVASGIHAGEYDSNGGAEAAIGQLLENHDAHAAAFLPRLRW